MVPLRFPFPIREIVAEPAANLRYGNQKFRFYIADQLHYERFNGSERITTFVDNGENPLKFEKVGNGKNSWQNNYMNYGVDWFINDRTSLNFLGEWRNWKGVANNYQSESKSYAGDALTEYLKTRKNTLDKSDNYYFSLFYSRKFKTEGNEFKAEAYYNHQTGRAKNAYDEIYIEPEDEISQLYSLNRLDLTENLRRNGELKTDLTFMIKNIRNEVGVRTYKAWMDNDFTKQFSNEGINNEQLDKFSYQEARQTAYYNLSGKIKKFSWQAGLRGEYSWLDINSDATTNYTVLLPQVSLSQSLPKEQNLKFSYRKQIFRPSIGSLNPFDIWTDSLHLRRGNPDLDPSIENRFELTYSKNFKANYLSPQALFKVYQQWNSG